MRKSTLNFCVITLAMSMIGSAFAAGEQILTMDTPMTGNTAVKKPTFVDNTSSRKRMVFLSVNYETEDCDWTDLAKCPEPFDVIFESAFANEYEVDADDWTPGVVVGGEIKFTATRNKPNGDECEYNPPGNGKEEYKCYIVRIKLKKGPKTNDPGFQYRVEMGGGVIDPRVRPK